MVIKVVTPSTITPWLLSEAKDHLRVRHSEDDGYIEMITFAVMSMAEKTTNRSLFTQTIRLYHDCFEGEEICLPRPVIQSVTSVKYHDSGGTLVTLPNTDYQVDTESSPGRLTPAPNLYWPYVQPGRVNAVEIEYVAGWSSRGQLPPALRQAMLYHLAHLYGTREPAVIGTIVATIPYTIQTMYAPFRVWGFY